MYRTCNWYVNTNPAGVLIQVTHTVHPELVVYTSNVICSPSPSKSCCHLKYMSSSRLFFVVLTPCNACVKCAIRTVRTVIYVVLALTIRIGIAILTVDIVFIVCFVLVFSAVSVLRR